MKRTIELETLLTFSAPATACDIFDRSSSAGIKSVSGESCWRVRRRGRTSKSSSRLARSKVIEVKIAKKHKVLILDPTDFGNVLRPSPLKWEDWHRSGCQLTSWESFVGKVPFGDTTISMPLSHSKTYVPGHSLLSRTSSTYSEIPSRSCLRRWVLEDTTQRAALLSHEFPISSSPRFGRRRAVEGFSIFGLTEGIKLITSHWRTT